LQARLRDAPGAVTLRRGDCGSPAWCNQTRDWLRQRHDGLDILVLNACAPPLTLGESLSGLTRRRRYVEDNLASVTGPIEALAELLDVRQGILAAVSSSIVESETQHWPQYKDLKHAVEAAVHAAVACHQKTRGLIVRPPGLLTDMSSTASRSVGALPPELVAARLADALATEAQAGRVEVLRDFAAAESKPRTAPDEIPVTGRQASIRLAATFTAKPLLPVLDFWCMELGWSAATELVPYNQVYQELLDPHSALSSNRSGLNVILLRFDDWLREFPRTDLDAAEAFLGKMLTDCVDALRAYCRRPHCRTLLVLCPESPGYGDEPARRQLIRRLGESLVGSVGELSGLDALWAEDWHAKYKLTGGIHDPLSEELAHIPFTQSYYGFLGTLIARWFHALESKPYKVIAVDCDNTLWRGVCGEVGASGITIDVAACTLQQFLLEQKRQGMLLCLCSKNNAEDVERVFDTRSDMLLARSDFVDGRVNWQPKSENLMSLAAGLKLGLDSFVFMDDSVVECAEVAAGCPQVLTLQLPVQAAELEQLLDHTWVFDHFEATEEDAKRTALYQADQRRRQLQEASGDFRAFLEGLNLEVDIEPATRQDLSRIAQLSQRTNQFNFTTLRRSEREIEALVEGAPSPLPGEGTTVNEGVPECRVVRVRDRFGEYGLVGLMTSRRRTAGWWWTASCSAAGC
jgi:FkbH-like protein